jgi:hypothetical protein
MLSISPIHLCIICTPRRTWGFHSGGYEEYHLLWYNAVWSVDCQPRFRRIISPPSSGSKKLVELETSSLPAFTLVSCSAYFFDPEDGSDVPPKRRLTLSELHGVISQKMVLFICTPRRTLLEWTNRGWDGQDMQYAWENCTRCSSRKTWRKDKTRKTQT